MLRRLAVAAAFFVVAAPAGAAPPDVQARAYVVQNGATGDVLARYRADARLPIASITKLMTVLVALERVEPDDVVVAPPSAASVGESTIHLRAGERITVRDLVKAALVQSANDAAWALAAHVAKGDVASFVTLMNAKARALGLTGTHFVRPDGLDVPGHVSTARDVTLLARVAMRNALVRSIVDDRTATIAGGRRLHTWNDLLGRFPGLVGVKTGHTVAAGWSQVAAVRGSGFLLYATIVGSPTRAQRNVDLAELLRWGLSFYRRVQVISSRRVYATAELGYGREPMPLVAGGPVARLVRVDRPLREVVIAPTRLELPVRQRTYVGHIRIYDRGRLIASQPLFAGRDAARPGFLARVWWSVKGLFS